MAVCDQASYHFQAICPALALSAILKAWEYDAHRGGDHFRYGDFNPFGFRSLEDLIERIADPPGLPAELAPSRFSRLRSKKWELGRCSTLPKDADPAASHRPLCNRVFYPSAQLDALLCRAGVWALS